jgi:hypothetical protein
MFIQLLVAETAADTSCEPDKEENHPNTRTDHAGDEASQGHAFSGWLANAKCAEYNA